MTNPLLANTDLPAFSAIEPEHVEPAIDHILADNRARLEALLDQDGPFTWDNLVQPVEALDDTLSRAWSPVTHLHGVMDSEGLREAYNACLPKLSEYSTELGQNVRLFRAFQQIRERDDFQALSADQQRTVDNALRDFRLAGVDLPEAKKTRYREIASRLSELGARFQENVLDATNAWSKQLDSAERLDGLPDSNLAMLAQAAEQQGESGYRIGLDFPSVFAILTHCRDRDLRREVYEAFGTRASDQGPHAGQWDNSAIMDEILSLRHEKAQLLGYDNYAELSLATKMAESTDAVTGFLTDLAQKARPVAEREFQELQAFARDELGLDDLQPWDVTFASEQLRQSRYAISQEDLRPYFPAQQVIDGLFQVVERLYGVRIQENTQAADTWHPDVQFFEILDSDGSVRGRFFTDLYARTGKRSGAWMAECKVRRDTGDGIQTAVAFLTCNFAPPVGDQPALLTHQEVETLFHEFGHGLHHMLTRVGAASVSGIHGVPWDAVELPSQFMENWCWEREALDLFAAHHETGARIPDDLFERMRAAKNFQSAMGMVRQLEFSLFDFRLHLEHDPATGPRILETLEAVRDQTAVVRPPEWHRFPHGFMHILAGGYAAGYYSYKWAEVLSADAYSRFEDEGVFSEAAGRDFLVHILEKGGSEDLMALYKAFRGREPTVDALLRHSGLAA
ncbi:oligopeptidase A [Aquisalimonas sp.]|uniref:oligopeptidase A n=1 Tax=Aquisalimonas sp. TaxID=1872621 RepID=UPI0025BAB766|nr:oligopeptidase A [Aquisalimonas sp.]